MTMKKLLSLVVDTQFHSAPTNPNSAYLSPDTFCVGWLLLQGQSGWVVETEAFRSTTALILVQWVSLS